MFSIAYVILPFTDVAPADAIRASLARFQRGGRGEVPDEWLTFDDDTISLRLAHETEFRFRSTSENGIKVELGAEAYCHFKFNMVHDEMRRREAQVWNVRFADTMDLDTFYKRFCRGLERHPSTGGYGRWLNGLGRWDWWDLGGYFDGRIIGEQSRLTGRTVSKVSSGPNSGRVILSNIMDRLGEALGQEPETIIDVRSDRNIELATTLLTDLRVGGEEAWPGAIVLPPGSAEDPLRWLDTWPELGPVEGFGRLGLTPEASWPEVVEAAYSHFQDHWVAGVAYHY